MYGWKLSIKEIPTVIIRVIQDSYTTFAKPLFCKHIFTHIRNIHGDEINHLNGKRSEWRCTECGKWELRDSLYENEGEV